MLLIAPQQTGKIGISTSSSEIHVRFFKAPPHARRGSPAFEHRDTALPRQATQYSRQIEDGTWQETRGQTASSGMSLINFLICALTSAKSPLKLNSSCPVRNAAYLSLSTSWLPLPKSMMEGFDGYEVTENKHPRHDHPRFDLSSNRLETPNIFSP